MVRILVLGLALVAAGGCRKEDKTTYHLVVVNGSNSMVHVMLCGSETETWDVYLLPGEVGREWLRGKEFQNAWVGVLLTIERVPDGLELFDAELQRGDFAELDHTLTVTLAP